jgi:hypothetical protein
MKTFVRPWPLPPHCSTIEFCPCLGRDEIAA